MQHPNCPRCKPCISIAESRNKVVAFGYFFRRSDKKYLRKYFCKNCKKYFSKASFDICYRQKKRHLNNTVIEHLASGNTQRRTAILLRINRKTVARRLLFFGPLALEEIKQINLRSPKVQVFEFDDLETYEHTKCKPLSVTLAVEYKSRRILGFSVSQMPAKGKLSKKSIKKYGPRKDQRAMGRHRLFSEIKECISETAVIKSDQNPHYPKDVKKYFPKCIHIAYKGRRPANAGQGELKEGIFDPLFSLNHTFAKLRADIARLIRETWTTTKKAYCLYLNIALMAVFHNRRLKL